jgi:uncharacterized membrane protein
MTGGLFIQGLITSSLPAGIIFFASGQLMQKYPPKWPNYWYGYRTMRALKTKESFDAANTFSAALMVKYGTVLMLAGLPLALLFRETYWWFFLSAGMLAVITCVLLLIAKTERYLGNLFP